MKPVELHNLFIAIDRGFACEMVLLDAELIRDGGTAIRSTLCSNIDENSLRRGARSIR